MKTLTKIISSGLLIAVPVIFSSCSSSGEAKENPVESPLKMSASAVELKTDMRKLWVDHVVWTRNVELCIIDDLGGKTQVVDRLMKNQDQIGNAMKTYYGEIAGKQLTDLLRTHISIAAEFLQNTKKGDQKASDESNKKWYKNAEEISEFLSKANPVNWKMDEMKMMMNNHLKLTTDEAMARKNKNYDADVEAFDKTQNEILKMADMLTDGILKQFPDKFKEMMVPSEKM